MQNHNPENKSKDPDKRQHGIQLHEVIFYPGAFEKLEIMTALLKVIYPYLELPSLFQPSSPPLTFWPVSQVERNSTNFILIVGTQTVKNMPITVSLKHTSCSTYTT